jgi:phosphatidylserine/phosphatidylglycerophosphate/cardiolipin synthase-like enzyme
MNVKSTDWDTHAHRVFESKRMKFASSTDERLRVQQKLQLPDLGPRKDYGIRIEGPAARDVDDVLRTRWDQALKDHEMYWEHASAFETGPVPDPIPGGLPCQVVATLPPPIAERSILETWTKALANATSYIYIEDQYYRMPVLNEVILKTLKDRSWVKLIVVTKPISISDGGKKYTIESDRLFRDAVPDQYLLLKLLSFDAVRRDAPVEGDEQDVFYFQDIDTHSKILIVDDLYLSVGSCNKNNRGLLYEGELNASVLDAAWTREARVRIFRNLMGDRLADQVTDDVEATFTLMKTTAEANAKVQAWWEANGPTLKPEDVEAAAAAHRPDGFLYPLEFTDDYLLDVGPDAF